MRLIVNLVLTALLIGCGGSTVAPSPKAAPAPVEKSAPPPSQAAPKPVAEAKPAAESVPPAQAKPAAQPPAPSTSSRLTMGSPPTTSGYYAYTAALAKLLQTKIAGLSITVSEGGGAPLNGKRLIEGKFDFAITGYAPLYPIYAGVDPTWKDPPLKEARALWVIDAGAGLWFVREDSGVRSVDQLHGKPFNPGGQGTGLDVLARYLLFPTLGVEPRWYIGGMDDALAAMKDRRIVGMGKTSAVKRPDALIQDAMTTMKVRALSWTPEEVEKVRAKLPFLNTASIPAGTYKADWNEKPITTWGNGVGMFTLARFSDNLAYAFVKAAVEDNKEGGERIQASAYLALKEFDITELTLSLSTVPLHLGSYRYLREVGAKIPDHLKPPEAN